MKAICAEAVLLDATSGIDVLKKIEYIGRTCYKSTDKISEGSAENFVSGLVKSGHEAMLEHASFIFQIDYGVFVMMKDILEELMLYGFESRIHFTSDNQIYLMSGNVRSFRDFFKALSAKINMQIPSFFIPFVNDNRILFPEVMNENLSAFYDFNVGEIRQITVEDLKTTNEAMIHCNATVKFIVDRGVSHEIVRHRPASFAQESTRYCNYTKDKFGKELTFIIPCFWGFKSKEWNLWTKHMEDVEKQYFFLIEECMCTPEEARSVLPSCLKTELIMTASLAEWHHFFELRACDMFGKAHPQIKEVARPLLEIFKKSFGDCFCDLSYEGK